MDTRNVTQQMRVCTMKYIAVLSRAMHPTRSCVFAFCTHSHFMSWVDCHNEHARRAIAADEACTVHFVRQCILRASPCIFHVLVSQNKPSTAMAYFVHEEPAFYTPDQFWRSVERHLYHYNDSFMPYREPMYWCTMHDTHDGYTVIRDWNDAVLRVRCFDLRASWILITVQSAQ